MENLPYKKILITLVVSVCVYVLASRGSFVKSSLTMKSSKDKLLTHNLTKNGESIEKNSLTMTSSKDKLLTHNLTKNASGNETSKLNLTIFLLAHYRTGSTLTASVLYAYPGAFYIFEPLQFTEKKTILLLNGRYIMTGEEGQRAIVKNTLSCNVRGFPLEILLRPYIEDSLVPISDCLISEFITLASFKNASVTAIQKKGLLSYPPYFHFQKCKELAFCVSKHELMKMREKCLNKTKVIEKCKNAPVRIFKYIRLFFNDAKYMMDSYPSLKVVTLLRDPRGYVRSDIAIDRYHVPRKIASEYCTWVRSVVSGKKTYLQRHPGRSIYTVHYEDLAMNPINTTRDMYEYLGMPFVSKVRSFVWNITMSGMGETCIYCVNRGNGTRQAMSWVHKINRTVYSETNNVCSDVIKMMGYGMPSFERLRKKNYNPYPAYRTVLG